MSTKRVLRVTKTIGCGFTHSAILAIKPEPSNTCNLLFRSSQTLSRKMSLPYNREELRQRWEAGERFQFYFFYGHKPPISGVDSSCLSQWYWTCLGSRQPKFAINFWNRNEHFLREGVHWVDAFDRLNFGVWIKGANKFQRLNHFFFRLRYWDDQIHWQSKRLSPVSYTHLTLPTKA